MTEQDLAQARAAVESILSALGVVRVVSVDDANAKSISVENVIAAAAVLEGPQILAAFPELGDEIPDDPDVLRQRLRDVWRQINANDQVMRGRAVLVTARGHDDDNIDDVADACILSDLIPSAKLISLSPEQWEVQKEQILRESQNQRTLFLFDQVLSEADGNREGGIRIIASLLARTDIGTLICGLLTHTVTPETQPQQWVEMSRAYNIPRDRFMVIPKLYFSQAPILFAQTLKFVALSPDFAELKRRTKEIISEAATVAAGRVEDVSIYDLDHIVFQVSAEEGLWEPDMLFRLHALFHRIESRRLEHEGGTLEAIAAKLRAVSGIPTKCDQFPPPLSAWALQREEFYEAADHINRNYLPVELGDIFEQTGTTSTKKYILLAQPCDLMVRADGKRHPELHRVPLAEVVSAGVAPHNSEEMPYFSISPTESWYVKFKCVHFVRVHILDLCVFNQNGIAKLIVNTNAPSGIRPAWKARHEILSHLIGRAIRKADLLAPMADESQAVSQFKQRIARDLDGLFFDDDLFRGNLTQIEGTRAVTYRCKRVGRISRARAIGLLMSYTAMIGRPAYDRDFGNAIG